MNVNRRWALIAIGAAPFVLSGCIGGDAKLTGTDLSKIPAPDFTLLDHRGQVVQLSALHGKTVVLTFIFTNCPDICPVTASNMRETYEQLSAELKEKVALIAITVDPPRDTAQALERFSEMFDLQDVPQWHALTGTRAELEPVWVSYGIDPGAVTEEVESHTTGSGRPYQLSHTDAVYLIDPEGRKRVLLRSSFDPEALARDIKTLSK
jgi:protein SCO1/2